jgi:transcriptional regulator GlxA family with amidase domain
MHSPAPLRIGILAFEGCMGLEVFGVADVLLMGNLVAHAMGRSGPAPFEVKVIALQGRIIKAAGGLELLAKRPRGALDLIVVPGLEINRAAGAGTNWPHKLARLQPELAFLRKSFARGTPVASVCVGAYLLAEAGLLNGRQATTAWIMAKDFSRRYPAVHLRPQAMLQEDGAVITSGAMSATFDLALHLIKRTLGAEIASATARIALLPQPRESQAPYIDARLLAPPPREASTADQRAPTSFASSVVQWLSQRLQEPYSLERLAQAFHVSPRTLMRRVKAETGHSPLTLLQQERVNQAKQLLQTTAWSIPKIVEAVGYSDVATFSRLFVAEVGETPARYRRRQ